MPVGAMSLARTIGGAREDDMSHPRACLKISLNFLDDGLVRERHNRGSNTGVDLLYFLDDTSYVRDMKTKYRCRFNVESNLRVCLSKIAPRIDELCPYHIQ